MTRPTPTTREAVASLAKYHTAIDAYHERKRQERLARTGNVVVFPGKYVQPPCDVEN